MRDERTDKDFRVEKTGKTFVLPGGNSVDGMASRRSGHGSQPWLPQAATRLRQPQDGSMEQDSTASPRTRPTPIRSPLRSSLVRNTLRDPNLRHTLEEPEDAGLTGGTRSLTRRVLGLNGVARSAPVAPAAMVAPRMDAVRSPRQVKSAALGRPDPRAQIA